MDARNIQYHPLYRRAWSGPNLDPSHVRRVLESSPLLTRNSEKRGPPDRITIQARIKRFKPFLLSKGVTEAEIHKLSVPGESSIGWKRFLRASPPVKPSTVVIHHMDEYPILRPASGVEGTLVAFTCSEKSRVPLHRGLSIPTPPSEPFPLARGEPTNQLAVYLPKLGLLPIFTLPCVHEYVLEFHNGCLVSVTRVSESYLAGSFEPEEWIPRSSIGPGLIQQTYQNTLESYPLVMDVNPLDALKAYGVACHALRSIHACMMTRNGPKTPIPDWITAMRGELYTLAEHYSMDPVFRGQTFYHLFHRMLDSDNPYSAHVRLRGSEGEGECADFRPFLDTNHAPWFRANPTDPFTGPFVSFPEFYIGGVAWEMWSNPEYKSAGVDRKRVRPGRTQIHSTTSDKRIMYMPEIRLVCQKHLHMNIQGCSRWELTWVIDQVASSKIGRHVLPPGYHKYARLSQVKIQTDDFSQYLASIRLEAELYDSFQMARRRCELAYRNASRYMQEEHGNDDDEDDEDAWIASIHNQLSHTKKIDVSVKQPSVERIPISMLEEHHQRLSAVPPSVPFIRDVCVQAKRGSLSIHIYDAELLEGEEMLL
jgi:hypothetical protein